MDKKNIKMPRFNLKCVWDGIRSSVSAPAKDDAIQIEETLRSEHFQIAKVGCRPNHILYIPLVNAYSVHKGMCVSVLDCTCWLKPQWFIFRPCDMDFRFNLLQWLTIPYKISWPSGHVVDHCECILFGFQLKTF